jgi:predicted ester cyclase
MREDQLLDFARRYTAAWCSQNAASVAAFYSANGSLSVNGSAPARERTAITEVAQSFMTAFPDMQVILDKVLVQGDRPEYHWTLIGTNTGPGGTGHRVRISGFETWQFADDGLIFSSRGQFDDAEYRRQLEQGVSPASPSM